MKKVIIIATILLILAVSINSYLKKDKEYLPETISDIITYEHTVSKREKKQSLQDAPDYFVLMKFNDEEFTLQKNRIIAENDKSYSKDNLEDFNNLFGSFKNIEIYQKVSTGSYLEGFYIEYDDLFVVYFILEANEIAVFHTKTYKP